VWVQATCALHFHMVHILFSLVKGGASERSSASRSSARTWGCEGIALIVHCLVSATVELYHMHYSVGTTAGTHSCLCSESGCLTEVTLSILGWHSNAVVSLVGITRVQACCVCLSSGHASWWRLCW